MIVSNALISKLKVVSREKSVDSYFDFFEEYYFEVANLFQVESRSILRNNFFWLNFLLTLEDSFSLDKTLHEFFRIVFIVFVISKRINFESIGLIRKNITLSKEEMHTIRMLSSSLNINSNDIEPLNNLLAKKRFGLF